MRVVFGAFLLAFGLLVGLTMGMGLAQIKLGREGRMARSLWQAFAGEAEAGSGALVRTLATGVGCVGLACLGALILRHPASATVVVSDGVDRTLVVGFLTLGFGGGLAFWAAVVWGWLRVRHKEAE